MGKKIAWTGLVLGSTLIVSGLAAEGYLYYKKPANLRSFDYIVGELKEPVCITREEIDLNVATDLIGERLTLEKNRNQLSSDPSFRSSEGEYTRLEDKYGRTPLTTGGIGALIFLLSGAHLLRSPSSRNTKGRYNRHADNDIDIGFI